jgi:hypothetical protein
MMTNRADGRSQQPRARQSDEVTTAILIGPPRPASGDRYDLEQLFLAWAWGAQFGSWKNAVRVLGRALRGLEQAGLIERRTIRRGHGRVHHGFVLTADGQEAIEALRGDWIRSRPDSGRPSREAPQQP